MIKLHDSETQRSIWVDSKSKRLRELMKIAVLENDKTLKRYFDKNKIDFIPINTESGYIEPLVSFFTRRIRH